jgi:hypothetical protein
VTFWELTSLHVNERIVHAPDTTAYTDTRRRTLQDAWPTTSSPVRIARASSKILFSTSSPTSKRMLVAAQRICRTRP